MTADPGLEAHNAYQRAYYTGSHKTTMKPADSPYVRRHVDQLLAFAGVGPGDAVLDVGCGEGKYTLEIAARGVAVEGVDLTPALLDRLHAADGGRYGIRTVCADVRTLADRDDLGPYDAVVGFMCLHHMEDLDGTFAALRTVAKPGATVAFLEPNAFYPGFYAQVALTPGMTWQAERGIVRMRPGVVGAAMSRAGLRDVTVRRFGWFPPMVTNRPGGARLEDALDALPVPRLTRAFAIFGGRVPG